MASRIVQAVGWRSTPPFDRQMIIGSFAFAIVFFSIVALSPARFFRALGRRELMSPAAIWFFRLGGIFCALGVAWKLLQALQPNGAP